MKTLYKSLLALSASSLIAVSAQAAPYGAYTGTPYIGVKVGQVSVDENGLKNVDDPTTYGIYGGYNFDPNFGIELEYMGSDDADFTNKNNVKGKFDVKNYGAYGTYRYHFPNSGLYTKGKLGVAKSDAEFDYASKVMKDFSRDDTSIAGGVGIGFNMSPNAGIEAEYSMVGGDNEARTLTLGAHLKF